MAFMLPRFAAMTSLPVADPGGYTWIRAPIGGGILAIRAGDAGLPYGLYAHLILGYITATARETGSRRISMGVSFADAMRRAGIAFGARASGGERGTLTRYRDQARRLCESTLIYVRPASDADGARRLAAIADDHESFCSLVFGDCRHDEGYDVSVFPFTDHSPLWTITRRGRDGEPIEIELSREAYDLITEAPIHLDPEAVLGLGRDVLGLQVYAWMAYQATRRRRADIKLAALRRQLGAEGQDGPVYRSIRRAVARVLELVPAWAPHVEVHGGSWSRDPARCAPAWLAIRAPLAPAVGTLRDDGAEVAARIAARDAERDAAAVEVVTAWQRHLDALDPRTPFDDDLPEPLAYKQAVALTPDAVLEASRYLEIRRREAA